MPKKLILVRHGKTNAPVEKAFYGSTDLDLAPEEFDTLKAISKITVDKIYCSPKKRCLQTSALFFPTLPIETLENAKEVDFGDWEGLTFPEIEKHSPHLIDAWSNDPNFSFPNGESLKHFQSRCEKLAKQLMDLEDETILLVCHGGVIRYLLCYFLDIDYQDSYRFQASTASFSYLQCYGPREASLNKFNLTEGFTWLESL